MGGDRGGSGISELSPGSGIALGISLGVTFGVVFDNIAMGLALGVAFGAALEAATRNCGAADADDDSEPRDDG